MTDNRLAPAFLLAALLCAVLSACVSAQAAEKPLVKKGVGSYSNVLSAGANMQALGVGWYYNWGTAPDAAVAQSNPSVQFIPMIWSHRDVNSTELAAAKAAGSGVLLGFNEPNVSGQANMTVAQAIADWPNLMATGLRLGSPASGTGDDRDPNGWLAQFMAQAKLHGLRVDFICIHPYQSNFDPVQATANLKSEIAYVHEKYGLPIWITEYGMVNWDTNHYPGDAAAAQFAVLSAAMMNRLPYVERYAWYSLIPNQKTLSLTSADGSLTVVGRAWAVAGGRPAVQKQ
jgi:hypothetical protein